MRLSNLSKSLLGIQLELTVFICLNHPNCLANICTWGIMGITTITTDMKHLGFSPLPSG